MHLANSRGPEPKKLYVSWHCGVDPPSSCVVFAFVFVFCVCFCFYLCFCLSDSVSSHPTTHYCFRWHEGIVTGFQTSEMVWEFRHRANLWRASGVRVCGCHARCGQSNHDGHSRFVHRACLENAQQIFRGRHGGRGFFGVAAQGSHTSDFLC